MKPLVSVIVPVYKVENYLARCLDSLCRQKLQNIEIILVDDGSPDCCGEICEEYAMKDDRYKVIHHPNNRGLSAARNSGIKEASADYLMFVDSDDYVHDDFCRQPYECSLRYKADLVLFGYQPIVNQESLIKNRIGKTFSKTDLLLKGGYKTKTEALDLILWTWVGYGAFKKLYHNSLFKTITYPVGYLYEDVGTTYKTVLQANCIYYLDKALYFKSSHVGNITSLKTKKALKDRLAMAMQQYRDLSEWGGYSSEKLELFLMNEALMYCLKSKRDFADRDYAFCSNKLLAYDKIPEIFSWKQKVWFQLFKCCPVLFEQICTLKGTKWC